MSLAAGSSKAQAAPNSTVLVVLLQVITGAVVSTTLTVWLHRLKLPQASVACQMCVASKVIGRWRSGFGTVLTMVMVMLVSTMSLALGASTLQAVPNSTG